jgi:hypothetical protein
MSRRRRAGIMEDWNDGITDKNFFLSEMMG